MKRLIGLYPRGWRERYGEELAELVDAMAAEHPFRLRRLRLSADLIRGAWDAHRYGRRQLDPAVRRGVLDGLCISVVTATVLVLSNVVFPAGPAESDNDPEFLVPLLGGYLLLAGLLVLIGARARRRSDRPWAGALGGAAAGLVMALAVLVASLVIDNAFLSVVSQQHDKRVAFEASGFASTRLDLSLRTILGAVVVVPFSILIGGALGLIGGVLPGSRAAAR